MEKQIVVRAYRTQKDQEDGYGCEVEHSFDTLKEARQRAKYYLSEAFRLTSEATERLGYSAVYVNGKCINDYNSEVIA